MTDTKDDKKEDVSSDIPQRPVTRSAFVHRALAAVRAAFTPGSKPEDSALAVLRMGAIRADIVAVTGWSSIQVEQFLDRVAVEDASFFRAGDKDEVGAVFRIAGIC